MAARFPVPASSFVPFNEVERLRALTSTCLLDSACDPAFDAITRAAASAFQAQIAAVSLIDQHRQWFKSSVGVDCKETLREDSFCTHTILQRTPMLVLDAREDRRFCNKPMVTGAPGLRFYLGVPIRAEDGMPIGALCVADIAPRVAVAPEAIALLQSLAANVEKLIRAHRAAGYIDAGTRLPNQRRFRENAYAVACRTAAAELPTQSWAISIALASETEVSHWLESNDERLLDARLKIAAKWIAGAMSLTRQLMDGVIDGVYRLSTRHLGFFAKATSAAEALTLTTTLQQGLDRLFPETGDPLPSNTQRWPVRVVATQGISGAALIDRLLTRSTACAEPCADIDTHGAPTGALGAIAIPISPMAPMAPTALMATAEPTASAAPTQATRASAVVSWELRQALASCAGIGFAVDTGTSGLSPALRESVIVQFAEYCAVAQSSLLSLHIAMPRDVFFSEDIGAWLPILARFGLNPSQISWTISVDIVRDALGLTKARCEQVRATGIGVVVTGFGAGYDSLAWLPSLSLSGVSFDPRVIDVVCGNPEHAATVRRIVSLAHALSVRVCAPGLRDAMHVATARLLNCDEGTGAGLSTSVAEPLASLIAAPVAPALDDPSVDCLPMQGTGANGADHGGMSATGSAFTEQGGIRTARFKEN